MFPFMQKYIQDFKINLPVVPYQLHFIFFIFIAIWIYKIEIRI